MKHRRLAFQILLGLVPVVMLIGLLLIQFGHRPVKVPSPHVSTFRPERNYLSHSAGHRWLNGVALHQYDDLDSWQRSTGESPDIVALYTRLKQPFPFYEARTIARLGALPLLQVNPRFTSMKNIADGGLDAHIRQWSASLHRLGIPVAVSFAHEMNGTWDTWGCGQTPSWLFVKVWRHVHDLIGTHNVIWIWNINQTWNGSCRIAPLYPGDSYVDWVGIDGYLRKAYSTWHSVFAQTLRQVKQVTSKSVLIAETGVPAGLDQARRIYNLFRGSKKAGLIGLVWFDAVTYKGDYRPQDNPGALRAFRYAIARMPS